MSGLESLKEVIVANNSISQEKYDQFDVKRGLRNKDDSGVLAGLTRVASVIGVKTIDSQRVSVDGELTYRGKSIFEIADTFKMEDRFVYEKASYLLLTGEMPQGEGYAEFLEEIKKQSNIPDYVIEHALKGIQSKNIMNKLEIAINALYPSDSTADSMDPFENFKKSISLIAKTPILVAYAYLIEYKKDAKLVKAPKDLSIAESFLYILHEGQKATELETQILDLCMALHAEHGGGNNSTFAARVVTSTNSDIYSAMSAGVGSLKGPLHGSANYQVMSMMDNIKANVKNWNDKKEIKEYLAKIIKKEVNDKSGKIYGLGHAVYTKSDPRAIVLKKEAHKLAMLKNRQDELNLYLNIEELGPEVFAEVKGDKKVIAPNVDFFSGYVYDCLGVPSETYTAIFAMSRISGWCAHRLEEMISGKRIIRPGYKFV
jgi:citrate synthase